MGFADLLDEVGGFGRFQLIHVILLAIPGLLMASQNLLNNFTAGVPTHHCRIPNVTTALNESTTALLRAFIPLDSSSLTLSKCSRYTDAQWHLITDTSAYTNATGLQTEGCAEGWTYDKTEFISSIVSEAAQTQACQDIESIGFLTRTRTALSSVLTAFVQVKRRAFTNASASKNAVVCSVQFTSEDYHPGDTMEFNMGCRSKNQLRLGAGAVPSVHTAPSSGPPSACGSFGSVRDAARRKRELCTALGHIARHKDV